MTTKLYIDDHVRFGVYDHLGPLAGITGVILSFANVKAADVAYQSCNIRRGDNGARLPCVDSRVLLRVSP